MYKPTFFKTPFTLDIREYREFFRFQWLHNLNYGVRLTFNEKCIYKIKDSRYTGWNKAAGLKFYEGLRSLTDKYYKLLFLVWRINKRTNTFDFSLYWQTARHEWETYMIGDNLEGIKYYSLPVESLNNDIHIWWTVSYNKLILSNISLLSDTKSISFPPYGRSEFITKPANRVLVRPTISWFGGRYVPLNMVQYQKVAFNPDIL